jgi:hypothetical protein
MPSLAERRHAKALRRRAKRRLDGTAANTSLAERVRRSASAPIHACLIQQGLFESGMGVVMLARRSISGEFFIGFFLVDAFCLGIKDVGFRSLDASEFESFMEVLQGAAPLAPAEPGYARKLLQEAAAYARSIGFAPHRDFAAVEPLFGDVSADACEATFRFGLDGKPCYIAGPTESPGTIRRRMEQLSQRLGDDAFDYVLPVD